MRAMRRDVLTLIGVAMVTGPLLLAQSPASAPRPTASHPDLQGVWNFSTITPLERPAEFAGKEFLTDQEARQYEARRPRGPPPVPRPEE